jgi:hypothetical protein
MGTNKEKEYWNCLIGPIERDKVPHGGDFPLRWSVREKFEQMFGFDAPVCSSGWGVKEDMKDRLSRISLLSITDPSGEKLRLIDEILSKKN